MVSIMDMCNDLEELVCGYQHCNTSQVMIFGRYVKVRESYIHNLLFGSIPF